MSIYQYLAAIFGVGMSLAHYVQAYRLWKRKSSHDISLLAYSVFALGSLVWTIYGISTGDWAIIISYLVGVIGAWLVLALSFIYRKK